MCRYAYGIFMERNTVISCVDLGCGPSSTNNCITRSKYFSFNAGDITQLRSDLKRLIRVLSDAWKVISDGEEYMNEIQNHNFKNESSK